MKREGSFIDPTRFLQTRMFEMPQWVQICDDFKLEYKGETIAAGTIVGVAGQKQLDTSPTLTNGIISQPDDLDIADDPMLDIQEYK
ncbi:protein jagged-2, partial [Mytilus galloprovincialis]